MTGADAPFIEPPRRTGAGRLPGEPAPEVLVARILRAEHAAARGAMCLAAGRRAVLGAAADRRPGDGGAGRARLEALAGLIADRRVRPSALLPLWEAGGYLLGAGAALFGPRAAEAVAAAVAAALAARSAAHLARLGEEEAPLRAVLEGRGGEGAAGGGCAADGDPACRLAAAVVAAGADLALRLSERL